MAKIYNQKIPTSFTEALRMCKDYAKAKHNMSVERIADEMGMTPSRLYQHLDTGDMPFNRVRSFQSACKCSYVTMYMAHSDDCMLIKIPTGKKMTDEQMLDFQSSFNKALTSLTEFYKSHSNPDQAMADLTNHMTVSAWHRANLEKALQPELDFEGEE